ncbi:hypothetical protein ACIA8K_40360 [Catenuloplanes sp. NPDC051500]|uniref:hypothetical protein n=1 Tax=Catenuloplanes sp. NPDC051500 TaxID=3363959 RepID=UPI00379A98AA
MTRVPTPFALALAACAALAGWALWTGGLADGPVARQVRTSSVYAAPGTGLDTAAAERVIGNRRLVVILLEPGADLPATCDDVRSAAAGTVVMLFSGDDSYGCALIGDEDDDFGKRFTAELTVANGVGQFDGRPLEAVKVMAVNYDMLVRSGTVPDGARVISPSLPRYLAAGGAVAGVLGGALALYATGRRAARAAETRRVRRDAATDARTAVSAAAASVAQQLLDLDRSPRMTDAAFAAEYRSLAADYAGLLGDLTSEAPPERLAAHVEALSVRARALSGTPG